MINLETAIHPEKTMREWLKTRQHLYAQLDYPQVVPLDVQTNVVERLNNDVGPQAPALENTPYPIWRVLEPKKFDLARIREFLAPYFLTAYQGADFWHKQYGWVWSLIVTPRVPTEVINKLNKDLAITGVEDHHTPCFSWAVNLEPSDGEKLLVEKRKALAGHPIVAHLIYETASEPSQEYSTDWDVVDEYFLQCSLGIAPVSNKFDFMRFQKLNAGNYGLSTEDIIKEVMLLDKQYGFDFVNATQIQLKRIPTEKELSELEEWFQNFVPDLAYEDEAISGLSTGLISFFWD